MHAAGDKMSVAMYPVSANRVGKASESITQLSCTAAALNLWRLDDRREM